MRDQKALFTVILGLFFILISATSFAESNQPSESLSLEEILNIKIKVASKISESLADASSSVTVFTAQDIRDLGVFTVNELLNFVPGFHSQDNNDGAHEFGARQVVRGHESAFGGDVLTLVNGQRINNELSGGMNFIGQRLAVENIEQIEVIRGPGSAIYGSNAFLGVVSITTKTGKNEVFLDAGNLSAKRASANFSKTIGDLELSAFVRMYSDSGYHYKNVTDTTVLNYTVPANGAFPGSVASNPSQQTTDMVDPVSDLDASLEAKYKEFDFYFRYGQRTNTGRMAEGLLTAEPNDNYLKNTQTTAFLKFHHQLDESMHLDLSGGYEQNNIQQRAYDIPQEFNSIFGPLNPPGESTFPSFNGVDANTHAFTSSADFNWHLSNNDLLAGVLYEYYKIDDTTTYENVSSQTFTNISSDGMIVKVGSTFPSSPSRGVLGVYVSDKYQIIDPLALTLGVRFDHYSDVGDSLNPRAALVYSAPWDGKFKLMAGTAFRAPSFTETYSFHGSPIADSAASNVKPEKVATYEAAYVQNLKPIKSAITATYFINHFTNQIVATPVQGLGPGIQDYYNLGDETMHGLEIELRAKPGGGLTLIGAYSKLFNADTTVPVNTVVLAANYLFWEKLNVGFNGTFADAVPNSVVQGDYAILNSIIRYSFNKDFSINFDVKNIFDRIINTYSADIPTGSPQRGRTFTLGLAYNL